MRNMLLLSLLITASNVFAQKKGQARIDSLQHELSVANTDTDRVKLSNKIGMEFLQAGKDSDALDFANRSIQLAHKIKFSNGEAKAYNLSGLIKADEGKYEEALADYAASVKIKKELNDQKGVAAAVNNIGIVHERQGKNVEALANYFEALKINTAMKNKSWMANNYNNIAGIYEQQGKYAEALKNDSATLNLRVELGEKNGIAGSYNRMGSVYKLQGNYPQALSYYYKALKIREAVGDKNDIADSYTNIGTLYREQDDLEKALENYKLAQKLQQETGYKRGMASSLNNIAIIYRHQGKNGEALKSSLAALEISKAINDKQLMDESYGSIANIYQQQGNYAGALENQLAALKLSEEMGYKNYIAASYINLGVLYGKLGKFPLAKSYLTQALALGKEIGSRQRMSESYADLSETDSATGNWKSAYDEHKLFTIYRDSLVNEANTRKTTEASMQYEFDKKEASTKSSQDKKDAITFEEAKQQRNVRNSLFAGLAGVLLFSVVVYRQRNKILKGKKRSDELLTKSDNLLLNILPSEVAEEIKQTGVSKAKTYSMVTVMFTDFKDFTAVSEKVSGELLVAEIDHCFSAFDHIVQKYRVEKIKTVGDAYICAGGMPALNFTHATDIVNAALEIRTFMLERKKEKEAKGEIPFELRIGIHTGPLVAGIVGVKKYAYDIWGDTVNLAARMESSGAAGEINISGSTYDLVKDKFACTHRGKIEAKHKGMIDMYFVNN